MHSPAVATCTVLICTPYRSGWDYSQMQKNKYTTSTKVQTLLVCLTVNVCTQARFKLLQVLLLKTVRCIRNIYKINANIFSGTLKMSKYLNDRKRMTFD